MENKFKVGDKVRFKETGELGILIPPSPKCVFPTLHPFRMKYDSGKEDCIEIGLIESVRGNKGRPIKPKPIVALVVWDEDRDPVKTFTKFSEAKKFARELMSRPEVKKDSIVLYEVKKQYKMVAKTLNKLIQVK